MKLGDFELTPLSDGTFALDGGQMFSVVPKPLWEKKCPADSRNRVRLGLRCLLVRTGKDNVLIETGLGDKYDSKFAEIYAVEKPTTLPAELKKVGLRPEDIDIVINTHLHFDHCGWNTRRAGDKVVQTFPRARYFIQAGEWEHALHPTLRDQASYVPECFLPTEAQTELLEGNQEIIPGIRVEVIPGHTRDLQCVWIESEGQQACCVSDLIPTRAHLPYPWMTSFDLYPLETLANKLRLLPQLVEQETVVVFPHDLEVPLAKLIEQEGRIVALAVEPCA
jgi:glyoxylase-like metal-dependent hydrolase (beta-lactamase superfamily II)